MEKTEVVSLNRGNNTSCTVNLHGATIVSWKVFNIEQLFVSSESRFDCLFPIRGGIAIIYTQYGFDNIFMPNNGFARTWKWSVEEQPSVIRDGDVRAVFTLSSNEVMRENYWPYNFILRFIVVLQEQTLNLKLHVFNLEKDIPVRFNFAFMNYLAITDLENCIISGLKDCECVNRISRKFVRERRNSFKVDQWIDSVYYRVENNVELDKAAKPFSLKIIRSNLPDVALWNPWTDTVNLVTCLSEEEVKEMIVVVNGHLLSPCVVEPLTLYTVVQKMEAWDRQKYMFRPASMSLE